VQSWEIAYEAHQFLNVERVREPHIYDALQRV
jgi:hypothetical protein